MAKIKSETKQAVGETKISSYQKPKLERKTSMEFPKEIAEKFNAGKFCIQCSGCHGCR
ncbi:MAG: hypothetical protein WC891_00065 [Actinomycetota bacterium]